MPTNIRQIITPNLDFSSLKGFSNLQHKVVDPGSAAVLNIGSGVTGIGCGVLRVLEGTDMKVDGVASRTLKAMTVATGTAQIAFSASKTVHGALTIASVKATATAVRTNAMAATKIFKAAGGVLGLAYIGFLFYSPSKTLYSSVQVKNKLAMIAKKTLVKGDFTTDELKHLKDIAPKAHAKLTLGKEVSTEEVKSEMAKKVTMASLGITVLILTAIGMILGFAFTGGVGAIIATAVGLTSSVGMTALDLKSMVAALKKATGITNKERIIKIAVITIAIISLIASVALAPTLPLIIAAAAIGGLMVAVPLGGLIYLEVKQANKAEEERKLKERRKFAEELLGCENTQASAAIDSGVGILDVNFVPKPVVTMHPDGLISKEDEAILLEYNRRKKTLNAEARLFKALMTDSTTELESKIERNQDPYNLFDSQLKTIEYFEGVFSPNSLPARLIKKFGVRAEASL